MESRGTGAKGRAVFACSAAAILLGALFPTVSFAIDTADGVEKTDTPTVEKQIAEVEADGSLRWGEVADASVHVEVPYRITGTLPQNWDDFGSYYYEFHDELDPQLVIDVDSIRVNLAGGGRIN